MSKNLQKSVRLSEEENRVLMRECKKQKITASEYIRQALHQKGSSWQRKLTPEVVAMICDVYTYLDAPSKKKKKGLERRSKSYAEDHSD